MKNLFKRLSALILASVIFCGIVVSDSFAPGKSFYTSYAEAGNWYNVLNGNEISYSGEGDGSVTKPFLIETAEQLALVSYLVNNSNTIPNPVNAEIPFNKAFYKLNYTAGAGGNNGKIDLSAHSFTPIGSFASFAAVYNADTAAFSNLSKVFQGHFNGEYFIGSGSNRERRFFEIAGLKGGALFGAADSAYIRNFDLTGVVIDASGHCGAVVNAGIDTEARNISVRGSISSSGGAVGGVMGYGVRSSVFACENYAGIRSDSYAGGLAGAMIKGGLGDCKNEGGVSGAAAGGIMGYGMQASINRSINAASVTGTTTGEFIGEFNTKNEFPKASVIALLGEGIEASVETSTCIAEAGALIKDSFYYTDDPDFQTQMTDAGLIGKKNSSATEQSYIRVKGLDIVHMTGRMQQKLNMSDWEDKSGKPGLPPNPVPDLLFHKWWSYNDTGLPKPIKWEMWVDSISDVANDLVTGWIGGSTDLERKWPEFKSGEVLTAEKLAYLAYMVNRGLFSENAQQNLQLIAYNDGYGNIDLGEKLWIPFGTMKNPYAGETFSGLDSGGYTQSFISNMTINSALSYQSFFGVVKQRSAKTGVNAQNSTLKVKNIHLAGMDIWSGSIDIAAGLVSSYEIHEKTQGSTAANTYKYYQFINCITSGGINAYGNAVGLTAGYTALTNNSTTTSFTFYIIFQSGNAANITSFCGNACGLVFNFSNINSKVQSATGIPPATIRYGVIDCFNSGNISALKTGGIASGLISYIKADSAMGVYTCYNSGELYAGEDGVTANYAGNIQGSARCTFTNCYYRSGSGYIDANMPITKTGGGQEPLSLAQMQSGSMTSLVLGTSGYWQRVVGCNNNCPFPNTSYKFYNVIIKFSKHDGDVIMGSSVVELSNPLGGDGPDFVGRTSVIKAYPIAGNSSHISGWYRSDQDGETENANFVQGSSGKTSREFLTFSADTCVITVDFKSMYSLTLSTDIDRGVVSVLDQNAIPGQTNPGYYNTGIGCAYIYPKDISNTIAAKAEAKPGYGFEGWYKTTGGNGVTTNPYYVLDRGNNVIPEQDDIILCAKFIEGTGGTTYSVFPDYVGGSDSNMGTVSGGRDNIETGYNEFTFVAIANEGYRFVGWYEDSLGTTLKSASESYSFGLTVSDGDLSYYAKFVKVWTVYIHAGPGVGADNYGGTVRFVSGLGISLPNKEDPISDGWSGSVDAGGSVRVSATAGSSYAFGGWYNNPGFAGEPAYPSSPQTISNVTGDLHFYARFIPQYKLTAAIKVSIGRAAGGNAIGAGDYEEGDAAVIHAFAHKGYRFAGWYDGSGVLVSDDAQYSFIVTRSQTFTPIFEKDRSAVITVLSALGGTFIMLSCGIFVGFTMQKFYRRQKS